jgi:crossover junction endodeoxyribonuclease RuvC
MPVTLGIDPGSRDTGYGIVAMEGNRLRAVVHGAIHVPLPFAFPERLGFIHRQLSGLINEWGPDCMAIEEVFFANNAKSALKLGQARGAAILTGVNAGLAVHEYSALQIKQAVVGYGRASKEQVADMVRHLLCLPQRLNPHAADALAVAICHVNVAAFKRRCRLPETA